MVSLSSPEVLGKLSLNCRLEGLDSESKSLRCTHTGSIFPKLRRNSNYKNPLRRLGKTNLEKQLATVTQKQPLRFPTCGNTKVSKS